MTTKEARDAVEALRSLSGDDEVAHVHEDRLRADVLRAIASGEVVGDAARDLAAIALSTDDIEFARWCA